MFRKLKVQALKTDKSIMNADKFGQSFLTATLFVIVFFGFYFVFNEFRSEEKTSASSDLVDIRKVEKRIDDAVNRNLRNIDTERRMRNLVISAENSELSSKFKNRASQWNSNARKASSVNTFDIDISANNADTSNLSVEERLRLKMHNQEEAAEEAKRQKQEYIEAYKANALRDGWIVEVNDNLEVISAKRANE